MSRSFVKCHFVHQSIFGNFKTKTVKPVSNNRNFLTGTYLQEPFIKVTLKTVILNSSVFKGELFLKQDAKRRFRGMLGLGSVTLE